jgi:hypothetical protein
MGDGGIWAKLLMICYGEGGCGVRERCPRRCLLLVWYVGAAGVTFGLPYIATFSETCVVGYSIDLVPVMIWKCPIKQQIDGPRHKPHE